MKKYFYIMVLGCLLLQQTALAQKPLLIAISKCHPKGYDTLWLRHYDSTAQFVNLYGKPYAEAVHLLQQCKGLLLTGGEDVNPAYYHMADERPRCGAIDGYRDTLEMNLVVQALRRQMPILAICRGEQLMNIANGGTLTIDIPTDVPQAMPHNTKKGKEAKHQVNLLKDSRLYGMIQVPSGVVNSFHHQCVKKVANGFHIAAYTNDGVIEAIEADDTYLFMFGVQWHPERLDYESPFSRPLAEGFLHAATVYGAK
jgi:putative glutamine amidotransferase